MRPLAFITPLAMITAVAAAAQALPNTQGAQPRVSVVVGPKVEADVLGEREVQAQADQLASVVAQALERSSALQGSQVQLTLTDLKPNRPTFEQLSRTPGLDARLSRSIGGAAIEVQVTGPDGVRRTASYDYFSHNLAEVRGASTWQDAHRAYSRLASNLASGRLHLQ